MKSKAITGSNQYSYKANKKDDLNLEEYDLSDDSDFSTKKKGSSIEPMFVQAKTKNGKTKNINKESSDDFS